MQILLQVIKKNSELPQKLQHKAVNTESTLPDASRDTRHFSLSNHLFNNLILRMLLERKDKNAVVGDPF